MKFLVAAAAAVSLASAVVATQKVVYAPHIMSPTAGTIWNAGQDYNITWDTSDAPVHITNTLGEVLFRVDDVTWDNTTLAKGFNITDGSVKVTAPTVPTGIHYSIVLLGDSGNWSPNFIIVNKNQTLLGSLGL